MTIFQKPTTKITQIENYQCENKYKKYYKFCKIYCVGNIILIPILVFLSYKFYKNFKINVLNCKKILIIKKKNVMIYGHIIKR